MNLSRVTIRGMAHLFAALAVLLSACSVSFSTANIGDAWLATDEEGNNRVTTFRQDETVFYAKVRLQNAPDGTRTKGVWRAVEVQGVEPDFKIGETTLESSSAILTFKLSNEGFWPIGRYQLELYLNDNTEPARTLTFEVR